MILIFDIGKTNKKLFVFDENYRIVYEKSEQIQETTDEDGFPCEDIKLLTNWVLSSCDEILKDKIFKINAINVSAYGASFVHLDENNKPVTPLYNYLNPFPNDLKKQFFDKYGGEENMALETASPVLGNLNAGLQLYFLKYHKPLIFNKIKCSLHLPQWIALLISQAFNPQSAFHNPQSEMTSIGCHTMLWNFNKNDYHNWVRKEGIIDKFPVISESPITNNQLPIIGTGLHDSSAALTPYLATFKKPFVLISTGTWCISLNPFNDEPLTSDELAQDCLCYLTHEGTPVKAARYFGGNEHEEAVRKIASSYGVSPDFYKNISDLNDGGQLMDFQKALDEYVLFMKQMVEKQVASTRLAIGQSSVQQIFVDGGFSKNEIFMTLLAKAFPMLEVYAATVAQASALGAAVAVHKAWNSKPLPRNLIEVKRYKK